MPVPHRTTSAISQPGQPESIFISTHLKPGRWWLYARGAFKTAEPPIAGGKRNSTMNFVGVTINERLSVSDHVSNILGSCSSSTFALRTLRSRGMPCQALHEVTRATTLTRMLNASHSWWGLLNESDLKRPENFLSRARRGGFLPDEAPTFKTMAARADSALFGAIINNQHHVPRSLCKPWATRHHI